jgi:Type III restriction enzyme, res subunit
MDLYYPSLGDVHFQEKVSGLNRMNIFTTPNAQVVANEKEMEKEMKRQCEYFERATYQMFVQQWMHRNSPYRGLLLYHGLGTGKTCSAITIAETFLEYYRIPKSTEPIDPIIWVIASPTLQDSFVNEIYHGCTGDLYERLIPNVRNVSPQTREVQIQKLIRKRYRMFSYTEFANFADKQEDIVENKVIIVDEAHNLRSIDDQKRVTMGLLEILRKGSNNRLVLLSATPMYDKPNEILWLFGLLLANDKREHVMSLSNIPSIHDPNTMNILQQLSQEYVSYVKGRNPFTFAPRLSPIESIALLKTCNARTIQNERMPKEESNFWSLFENGIVPSYLNPEGKQQKSLTLLNENSKASG